MKKVALIIIGIVIIVVALMFGTESESNEDFLKKYTKGYMDITYLGDKNLYSEVTDITSDEGNKLYEESVKIESGYFKEFFELENITEEKDNELKGLIKEYYKKTKYEITEIKEKETDKYEVKLKISPLNVIKIVEDGLIKKMETATEDITKDENWNTMVIDILKNNIENVAYFEDEIVNIKIFKNVDGLFEFEQDSLNEIDNKVIKYDYNTKE